MDEITQLMNNKQRKLTKVEKKLEKRGSDWRKANSGKQVPPRVCADILEKEITFALVVDDINNRKEKSTAPLYYYDEHENYYIHDEKAIERFINVIENRIDQNGAHRILYWLQTEAPFEERTKSKNLVNLGNGVFDIPKQLLMGYDSEKYIFTSKVATDYVSNAEEPSFDDWSFSDWLTNDICEGDEQKEQLFWQAVYCTVNPNDNKKGCLLLIDDGRGNTGKGTLQQLFTNLVGEENRANLKLNQFEDDFKVSSAVNARLIVGDDNSPKDYIKDSSNLKSIIASENILYNPKLEKPFSATVNAFIVQSMNGMPRFSDTTPANYDRFRAFGLNKRYEGAKANPRVRDTYIADEQLLEWILREALQVKPFYRMIKTTESNQILQSSQEESNPVLEFVNTHIDEFTSQTIPNYALFNIFRTVYQSENGKKSDISQRAFTSRVKPLMKQHGWNYQKDKRVGNGWKEEDKDHFMHRYDSNYLSRTGDGYSYPFTVEPDDKGVFFKN